MRGDRMIEIDCGPATVASLCHYAPSGGHARHRHDFVQLSFLLAGAMHETLDGRRFELDHRAIGIKPAGTWHDDGWGRHGVLIFSLKLRGNAGVQRRAGWLRSPDDAAVTALARSCLLSPLASDRADSALDLIALAEDAVPRPAAAPPRWLIEARERMLEDPSSASVAAIADAAGVDRAHLSRRFRSAFGVPPSLYRQNCLTARAVTAIARSATPLSAIAEDAGFCDQSHLSRHVRGRTGLAPGRLRRLFGRAHHIDPRPGG